MVDLEWPLTSGSEGGAGVGASDRRPAQTDVWMFHTADGGEIEFTAGQVKLSDGLETSAYLSVMGGNVDDAGLDDDDPEMWWANFEEPVIERRQRSRTQHALIALPCIPTNLPLVEEAAKADLAWMVSALQATVAVTATLPALNTINIHVEITIGNTTYPFDFKSPWGTTE